VRAVFLAFCVLHVAYCSSFYAVAEVMLQSEGFQSSRLLAKKTVTLYALMVQQLSKQGEMLRTIRLPGSHHFPLFTLTDHYDYGLRSLRGVLVCAGALKRADPSLSEDYIVLRAIRDMNLPKVRSSHSAESCALTLALPCAYPVYQS